MFVATLHDSVCAFDADSNQGANAAPLWQVSFINPADGVTTVPASVQGCGGVTQFPELGIVSTPVIDPASGTIYVLAKTEENGTYVHRLHALDVATGTEKFNGPVVIKASYTAKNGVVVTFQDWGQMNRPGLLLANGNVYVAFGSNGCNSTSHGWIIGYDAGTLEQTGVFTTSPNQRLAGIWQSGLGPSADSAGNIYASTSEAPFDTNVGGEDLGMSIFKVTQGAGTLSLFDYFTPFNYAYLNANDLDLSSAGPIVLPDQPGPYPHLLVASGKNGDVYVLNRDNMGQFNSSGNPQIVQYLPQAVGFITERRCIGTTRFTSPEWPTPSAHIPLKMGCSRPAQPFRYPPRCPPERLSRSRRMGTPTGSFGSSTATLLPLMTRSR